MLYIVDVVGLVVQMFISVRYGDRPTATVYDFNGGLSLRGGKALLIDVPRWQLAWFRGNARHQLLARCAIAKQWGYIHTAFGGVRLPTVSSAASP